MVKFGIMLPQGWRGDTPDGLSPTQESDLILENARTAERLGFDSAWVFDHLMTYPEVRDRPVYECWTTLTAVAENTKTLRLGPLVACNNYRNPLLLAKIAATFDVFSHGRLEFGIGAGWYKTEHDAYGYVFPEAKTRLQMLDEALRLIYAAWSQEKVNFKGKFYSADQAVITPKPVQKPKPPVTIAGAGEQLTLKLVAKYGDMCNFPLVLTQQDYKRKFEKLDSLCIKYGRSITAIEKSCFKYLIVSENEHDLKKKLAEHAILAKGDHAMQNPIYGTPESVAEELRTYKQLGASYFVLMIKNGYERETLELVAKKVIPLVKAPN